MPVLRVSNLRVRYGQKVAVDGISFRIAPGEIYGLLGPNGAGKTSTIKAAVNLVEYSGEIDLMGMGRPRGNLLNNVGTVLETPAVLEALTVKEFLELVASIRGVDGRRIDALVQAFELNEYLGAYISTLSQGNKQKVAIVSALMHRPKLLILDEPFNALDVKSARILKDVVQNHRRDGGAVLFSTHVMEIAERMCDRIGILNEGKLVMEGTTKSILEQARAGSLEEAFLRAIHAEEEVKEIAEAL
ncbi:MAG: ABC transporter ATP-binding protein [Thaumarchaeota archaeon]|nr:ABC transporter ATP-binding protein [Nitrososphaerota archaeon]